MSAPGPRKPPPPPEVIREVRAAVKAGQLPKAIGIALRELDKGFEDPQLLHLRSTWHERQGRPAEALADLERAHFLDPDEIAVLMALGFMLGNLQRPAEARRIFERAARLRPDLIGPPLQLGWVAENLGEVDRARADYEVALKLAPRHPHAPARLASIAAQQGEWALAREFAVRTLANRPDDPTAHIAHARADTNEGRLAEAEERLLRLLGQKLSTEDFYLAQHAFGALLHVQGRYGEAFLAWADGNDAVHRENAARLAPPRGAMPMLEGLISHFSYEATWPRSPGMRTPSPPSAHVFLMGFARSGTTLLDQVLAAHPDVVAMEEKEVLLPALAAFPATAAGMAALREASDDELEPLRQVYWRQVESFGYRPDRKVFIDKSPFNAPRLAAIARLFPDAKIIFAVRDPRDVLLSCFRTVFRVNLFTFELMKIEQGARFYSRYMALAQLFREKLPLEFLMLRHEDLLDDFEGEIARVCSFIGIDLKPGMLDFANSSRRVATPSAHQLRGGLSRRGAGQWHHYESELAPALPHLQPWIETYGYR